MNSVYVVSTGLASDPEAVTKEPRYRKATRGMILANSSIEQTMLGFDREAVREDCGLVLGSCHGELEVTIDFLRTLSQTGVARPILFQNSLHNSTTGFLAMTWRITGPLLTVSRLHFTGEDALATGHLLVRHGLCNFCLITAVDARVAEMVEGLNETKIRSRYTGEGAGAVLLASSTGLERVGRTPRCELIAVNCVNAPTHALTDSPGHYESNGVELFVRALADDEVLNNISLYKPDGSHSLLTWR